MKTTIAAVFAAVILCAASVTAQEPPQSPHPTRPPRRVRTVRQTIRIHHRRIQILWHI
jgi:hypothetical protein